MAKNYTDRPKNQTARWAWDKFVEYAKQSPRCMSYGRAEHYGMIWTAELGRPGEIWGLASTWGTPIRLVSGRLNNF